MNGADLIWMIHYALITCWVLAWSTNPCTDSRCVCNYWKADICFSALWHRKQANHMSCLQKQKYPKLEFCRNQLPAAFCKHLPGTYMSNISMHRNWVAHRGILLFGTWDASSWVKDMSAARAASCSPTTLHCSPYISVTHFLAHVFPSSPSSNLRCQVSGFLWTERPRRLSG